LKVPDPKHTTRTTQPLPGADAAVRSRLARRSRQAGSQHRLLDDSFERVSVAFAQASLTETRASYLQLRAALEAHISLEDLAFFPTIHGLLPELTDELESLSRDHERFRGELEHLYDLLAEGAREAFSEHFSRFQANVHAHEEREEAIFKRSIQGHDGGRPTPESK
jgi:hypothetical protein